MAGKRQMICAPNLKSVRAEPVEAFGQALGQAQGERFSANGSRFGGVKGFKIGASILLRF
jgi:hypothetical protein